jgi:hypothetical protein
MMMAHSLITGDGFFAAVLAAWWQLRRSAHLLPHLRRGPCSLRFDPGYRFVAWIMAAIGTLQSVSAPGRPWWLARRSAVDNGRVVSTAAGPDGTSVPTAAAGAASKAAAGAVGSGRQELIAATVPIPVPAGLRPPPPRRPGPGAMPQPPSPSPPPSRPTPQAAVEPRTCPFPMVVGRRPREHPTVPVGSPTGPRGDRNGYGSVESPTLPPTLQPRFVVARRGAG